MQLKITDRLAEANKGVSELIGEINDYQSIVMCIRALQAVTNSPDRYTFTTADYDKVVAKLRNLCEKHEIVLPEYVEWSNIEIV